MLGKKYHQTYDYIIIGAGSAGCVLANRLSEEDHCSVLVLEAGPLDRHLMIHIPAGVHKAFNHPKLNWGYKAENKPEGFDRPIDVPRGKVTGGSSSINSMVYMRGHPLDYDRWGEDFALPQWSYDQCLPYFKDGETSSRGANDWRGGSGPLHTTKGYFDNPLYDAFLEAGEQSGLGVSEDLNGYQPEGVARFDSTTHKGQRCSAAVAHLRPAVKRDNCTLLTGAKVQKIKLDGQRAHAVQFSHQGQAITVEAEREIILSGGAINSPQTLMLSGIGPADQLKALGIDVELDLPGVGQNLQDHATVVIQYACTKRMAIHKAMNPINQLAAGAQWLTKRTGPAATFFWEAGALIRSSDAVDYPDTQYHFGPAGIREKPNGAIALDQGFSIHIDQSRPTSVGHIELTSNNPDDKPKLHFNYLSTEDDQRRYVQAIRKAQDLVSQNAFNNFRGKEVFPGTGATTDKDILASIKHHVASDYHPSCSCRMGIDRMAVVDEEMNVHGIAGLRVVDASVMPRITSANLNAPTQMIAARAADFILGKPQLKPFKAKFHFSANE